MKNLRSKSYDRALGHESRTRGPSTSQDRHALTYEERKRDMLDKDRLIEQKNREIVKLRMENDEMKADQENDHDQTRVKKQKRTKLMAEIEEVLDNIRVELEKTKINLFKKDSSNKSLAQVSYNRKVTEVITSEDNLLSVLQEKTLGMRNLTSLASEVFLLSNKHSKLNQSQPSNNTFNASPTNNYNNQMIQLSEHEYQKLVSENTNLQRSLK